VLILDTHIWVWWNQNDPQLSLRQKTAIEGARAKGIGICTISLLEIARLVQRGRILLPKPTQEWFDMALIQEGIVLISITPEIAIGSVTLPDKFHKDPADRLIVATARDYDCPLVTADKEILAYPYVKLVRP
jgi:PIN domain nuclease of toxin-antitoxin system